MEAHPRKLRSVFRADVRLVVPLFQRPYVWNETSQWLPLWEDLVATRDRFARGDDSPHFLGAVVLVQRPQAHGSLEVREVIDGQQRLTTLQLLICALRDAYERAGLLGRQHRQLVKLLQNDEQILESEDEIFRLWPTNRDRAAFKNVVEGVYRNDSGTTAESRIAAAYLWFREAIEEATESGDVEGVLNELTAVVVDGFEVVVIDLDEKDNAQVIFETLNARGTPLRASDLIKNLLFRTLEGRDSYVEALYERYWRPFEAPFWEGDVRVGRLNRSRLDTFMGYFLVLWLGREVQVHQVFPAARAWVGDDSGRALDFLHEVSRYAVIYQAIEQNDTGIDGLDTLLERLQIVDTQTVTPLLLWVLANAEPVQQLRSVSALESYLVRRYICRLTPKNYNRMLLELLKRLQEGATPVGEFVSSYLADQTSASGVWPSDAELIRSLSIFPLYKQLRRSSLEKVLRVLEAKMTSSRSEVIDRRVKLSVEHLLPQQWKQTWPADDETEAERRDELLHTIGNLTLITGNLNSSLSNKPWSLKRAEILSSSAISLNRDLPQEWTADSIAARSVRLGGYAVVAWPRPVPSEIEPIWVDESERDLRPDRGSGPDGRASSVGKSTTGGRRDLGAHILNAFRTMPSGTFLTIQQIKNTPSEEYGDDSPSAGAISARLFPPSGRPSTLEGLEATFHGGVRGARKL